MVLQVIQVLPVQVNLINLKIPALKYKNKLDMFCSRVLNTVSKMSKPKLLVTRIPEEIPKQSIEMLQSQ